MNVNEVRSTTDLATLTEMSTSESAPMREAVALNPATPLEILRGMSGDASPSIQRIVAKRLSESGVVDTGAVDAPVGAPTSPAPSATSHLGEAVRVAPSDHPVRSSDLQTAILQATQKAGSLSTIAAVVSVLGVVGSILLAIAGLILVGNEDARPLGVVVLASSVAGVLLWIFIGSFAQTVAAGVRVLAEGARARQ